MMIRRKQASTCQGSIAVCRVSQLKSSFQRPLATAFGGTAGFGFGFYLVWEVIYFF